MQELKIQNDVTAQIVLQINGGRLVMDNCKVFATTEDDKVTFQVQDDTNNLVQVTLTKVILPDKN